MRLSELEFELLVATQFSPLATVEELSKKLKKSAHRIQYALQKIGQAKVAKNSVLIDFRALGLEQYELYFSLYPQSTLQRRKTLTRLFHHEKVFWYAELGGGQPYGISFIAHSAHEASHFIETVASTDEPLFNSKEVASIISFTVFEKTYLLPPSPSRREHRKSLTIGRKALKATKTFSHIDDLDTKIIKSLLSDSAKSRPKLAQELNIPRATLEYRITRLYNEGICIAPLKFISAIKLGFQSYKLLITTKGVHPKFSEELYAFCLNEPNVTTLIHTLGSWDFEITLEVSVGQQVTMFIERLLENHNARITRIEPLPVFEQGVSSNFRM
jgi:DNA-binding Lrp family transcriptional regulator